MGVVGVGLLLGTELGKGAALLMVVGHGVCSPLVFSYAYYVYQSTHRRLLARCRGGLTRPVITAMFLMIIAVNIGVPPFVNLWREAIMFTALLPVWVSAWPAAGVSAFLGVAYRLFAYVSVAHGKEGGSRRAAPAALPYVRVGAAALGLALDIGYLIYLNNQFEVQLFLNSQSLYVRHHTNNYIALTGEINGIL